MSTPSTSEKPNLSSSCFGSFGAAVFFVCGRGFKMELLRSLLVFRLLHVIACCCLLASTQYTKLFLLMPSLAKKSPNKKTIVASPSVRDFRSIVSMIVFSASFGEELGRSAPTCFIFVNPCVFGWMFHVAQMLKEMKFWHAVEACRSFFPQLSPPLFQFGALLGHLLASFQKKAESLHSIASYACAKNLPSLWQARSSAKFKSKYLFVRTGSSGTIYITCAASPLSVGGPLLRFPLFNPSGFNVWSLSGAWNSTYKFRKNIFHKFDILSFH